MSAPDLIDNRGGNTLAQALRKLLEVPGGVEEGKSSRNEIRIATAFFSPRGFEHIAEDLARAGEVRLLLGADPSQEVLGERRQLGETETDFRRRQMEGGLQRLDKALTKERDRLPFSRRDRNTLEKLIRALKGGNIKVRRYEQAFLHAKAYIYNAHPSAYRGVGGVIVGSSNLTDAGMQGNLELNLGCYDNPVVEPARQWFDELWQEAAPYDLAALFEELLQLRTPWEIFLRVLWQLYGDEMREEEPEADGGLQLTSFQKHGVARAKRLIRETGGALVADEVGLGKTFIAGELLQSYRRNRQRVLIICSAMLRDSTWKQFLSEYQLFAECVSFEELAHDRQLADPKKPRPDRIYLQRSLDEYQLVIIDEAHNYRNPDAPTRAAVLRRLLTGQKRDLLLLTATPVNNSLWDLYHLLRFFVRQDAHFAKRGILSMRDRFELAMHTDPANLSPDLLYPIIDATTVKRTRQFVKKHYGGDRIMLAGRPVAIEFPEPQAVTVRYRLEELLPDFFDRLEQALDPDLHGDFITFARYTPDAWLLEPTEEEAANAGSPAWLLRSGLLKRFESSVFAFRKTLEKMAQQHRIFLQALELGKVVPTRFLKELSVAEEEDFELLLERNTRDTRDARLYDVERLRDEVQKDLTRLDTLVSATGQLTPKQDPKLRVLVEELAKIARQANREALGEKDARNKRKVLVFSFFGDTVKWIYDFLQEEVVKCNSELKDYRGRLVAVSGAETFGVASRDRAVSGFAPASAAASQRDDHAAGAGDYDLLITTDILAEGVNLQQCGHIINFDLPWNPMRLVQRHGRIDRIGSPHRRVFMRTIFPADRLDDLLKLEERILRKLALAAATIGVSTHIAGASRGEQVFTETREEIEKLLREDNTLFDRGGTESAAQTGEEYRQTLRKALVHDKNLMNLPWKSGSGMVKRGAPRGIFFCALVGDQTFLRFVPAAADWMPAAQSAVIREEGTCLRLIECEADTETWHPKEIFARAYRFWEVARADIFEDWMKKTDPINLQPPVRPVNLRAAEFIRDNTPPGMKDELITEALDILESPWPRREENLLHGWFNDEQFAGAAKAKRLIEQVRQLGLEPAQPPPALPMIEEDDIELLCWMALESEGR